ncbi:MAG: cytochrome c [Flavobacteriales bacterium]|nr:cytochrome c [Flavobacteriales bacterium]
MEPTPTLARLCEAIFPQRSSDRSPGGELIRSSFSFLVACIVLLFGCSETAREEEQDGIDLPDTVTFAEHIAPLLGENCTPCHRPGQAGPFSLITYQDARRKAKTIRLVTGKRYMPPWPADTSYSRFLGERVLSERQIALIAKWVDQGTLSGDTLTLPVPPAFSGTSLLGEPDAVVWLPDTFHVPGDGRDHFMIAKAPFELERDTFLRAIEFVPGNRRLVHHMNGAMVNYTDGAKRDVFASEVSYVNAEIASGPAAFKTLALENDDGSWPALVPSAVNYLPGMAPVLPPAGIGGLFVKKKGAFLLNSLHYGPSSRDTMDRSRFNLWFASQPPSRPLQEISMGSNHTPIEPPLHLGPGEVRTFGTSYTLTQDISVLTVNPHMHLLGKQFVAFAIAPSGDTIPLVRINDWDFRWQYAYTFPKLLPLTKGTAVHVTGTFDNTAANPNQPFDPPRDVTGTDSRFMRTTDEMFQFFITYIDHRPGDEHISLSTDH